MLSLLILAGDPEWDKALYKCSFTNREDEHHPQIRQRMPSNYMPRSLWSELLACVTGRRPETDKKVQGGRDTPPPLLTQSLKNSPGKPTRGLLVFL